MQDFFSWIINAISKIDIDQFDKHIPKNRLEESDRTLNRESDDDYPLPLLYTESNIYSIS